MIFTDTDTAVREQHVAYIVGVAEHAEDDVATTRDGCGSVGPLRSGVDEHADPLEITSRNH